MRRFLILLGLVVSTAPAFAVTWGAGLAMENRIQREVNPDYADMKSFGQLYAEVRFWPWALLIEGGSEAANSDSGTLHIQSATYSLGLWGRYEFYAPSRWSPFLSAGLGSYFDSVKTTFAGDIDNRTGTRGYFGLGAGIRKVLWSHLSLEAELRGQFVEDRKDPYASGLLRLGWQI